MVISRDSIIAFLMPTTGPIIWFAHFAIVYFMHALICGPLLSSGGFATAFTMLTIAALFGLYFVGMQFYDQTKRTQDVVVLYPAYESYRYFLIDDRICIVDPDTYEIVEVIVVA